MVSAWNCISLTPVFPCAKPFLHEADSTTQRYGQESGTPQSHSSPSDARGTGRTPAALEAGGNLGSDGREPGSRARGTGTLRDH